MSARDYLTLSARHDRDTGTMHKLTIRLLNLAGCLGCLGLVGLAWEAAAEALTCAETAGHHNGVRRSHTFLGWLAGLAGDITAAEDHFTTADQICLTDFGEHPYSFTGVLWGAVAG